MNILYLCDEYPPCQHGGIGTVTQTLARTIAEKGHKVVVAGFYPFYRKAAERENDHGVEVYRFFYGTYWKLKLSKHYLAGHFINIKNEFEEYVIKLKELIKDHQIEMVESTDFVEAFRYTGPRMIQFPDFGVPFIVKLHGSYSVVNDHTNLKYGHSNIYLKETHLLSMASSLIAVSKSVKERAAATFKILQNIEIINNGIFLNNLPKNKIEINENRVVFAGTLDENKGIFSLLRAWVKVIEAVPTAVLNVYGKGSTASIETIDQVITSKFRGSVKLMGFVKKEDLAVAYTSASCAIFPSFSETFGMAPIEAMSVGCPTIFTKNTSGPEIINHGVDGLLVDPNNVQEIADAIIYLLSNYSVARKMGENASIAVREKYCISSIAEKHIIFYLNLLSKVK